MPLRWPACLGLAIEVGDRLLQALQGPEAVGYRTTGGDRMPVHRAELLEAQRVGTISLAELRDDQARAELDVPPAWTACRFAGLQACAWPSR